MRSDAGPPATLLAGARNFRPVAPYPAAGGRHLRENTLYRSGELSRLNEADLAVIAGLNIRLVCDLRTAREQSEFLSRWPKATGHRRLDLPQRDDNDAGWGKMFELINSHAGEEGAVRAMDLLYRAKPKGFLQSLGLLFDTILAGDALPLLIHCHAGKDRTGFIIAMLLFAVGVSRENIIEDYVLTATYFPVETEARGLAGWAEKTFGQPIHHAAAIPMVDARRPYIEAALHEIETGWGSIPTYLESAGLTPQKQQALQSRLLTP